MPYKIRKDGKSGKEWCVYKVSTDERKGCSETEAAAKKFLQVLNMREAGVPEKKEAIMDLESVPVSDLSLTPVYEDRLSALETQMGLTQTAESTKSVVVAPVISVPTSPTPLTQLPLPQPSVVEAIDIINQYVGGITKEENAEKEEIPELQQKEESEDIVPEEKLEEKEMSLGQQVHAVRRAFETQHIRQGPVAPGEVPGPYVYVNEVFEDHVIVSVDDKLFKYTYKETKDGFEFSDPVEVERKVEFVEKSAFDKVAIWVKSIFDKVCDKEDNVSQEITILTLPSFITKQQADGRYRWTSISSTAFRDHEAEIVSTQGISKALTRSSQLGYYGPLNFWHEPIKVGACDFQAQDGVCLVESGLWDDTSTGVAARKSVQKVPENWAISIGFLPLASQGGAVIKGVRVNHIWTDLVIVERSILPNSQAASLFTAIQTRSDNMDQAKEKALRELLGDEADSVLASLKEINEKASESTAVFKAVEDAVIPTSDVAVAAEKSAEPPAIEPPAIDDAIATLIKSISERLDALTTDMKVLKASSEAPRAILQRPSVGESEIPEVTKDTADYPRVIKAIGHRMVGAR